jgi:site-specific DNA recombinase
MIAEYEKAQIIERTRRGKAHRARAGVVKVLSGAPYGYRDVPKSDHAEARYEVCEPAASVVRELLAATSRSTPRSPTWPAGRPSSSSRPAPARPAGTAPRCGGCCATPPTPAGPRSPRPCAPSSGCGRPGRGGWPAAAAPATPSPATGQPRTGSRSRCRRSSARRASSWPAGGSRTISGSWPATPRCPRCCRGWRPARPAPCADYRTSTRTATRRLSDYRCRYPGGRRCANLPVRADHLDQVIWDHVTALLADPTRIRAELDRRLGELQAANPTTAAKAWLQREQTRTATAISRLVEAYQERLLSLAELREPMPTLRAKEQTPRAQLDALEPSSSTRRPTSSSPRPWRASWRACAARPTPPRSPSASACFACSSRRCSSAPSAW